MFKYFNISVFVIALVVIFGWIFHIPELVQINPSWAPMQFNTAICFVLISLSFLKDKFKFLSIIAMLIGGLTLFEYFVGSNLGIDEILFKHWTDVNTSHVGRMAPNTAICFIFLGLTRFYNKMFFASCVFGISFSSLIGYLFSSKFTYMGKYDLYGIAYINWISYTKWCNTFRSLYAI